MLRVQNYDGGAPTDLKLSIEAPDAVDPPVSDPTDTPTATATPTDTPTATATPTPTNTATPTPTPTDTATVTPTPTDTPTPTATVEGSTLTDREALVALYNATDGANWTDNTNWLSQEPLSTWHGITTNSDGNVTNISLPGNVLSGTIPPSLDALDNLLFLSLGNNQLSGSIPARLGNLQELTNLYLTNNQLSGSIPPELGNISSLKSPEARPKRPDRLDSFRVGQPRQPDHARAPHQ